MTRRPPALSFSIGLAAAVVAVGLSGCATFSDNDAAATVNGVEITRDDFETVLQAFAASPTGTGSEDPASGTVDAALGRQVLDLLIRAEASDRYLDAAGESISDEDRQAGAGAEPEFFAALPDDLRASLNSLSAGTAARARLVADEARAAYEASPADVGFLCLRAIVVETEADALDVVAEIEAGADFATLAAERSLAPDAAASGGAVLDANGGPCIPAGDLAAQPDNPLAQATLTLAPGDVSAPVETANGWFVVAARPFDEVADVVSASIADAAFGDYVATIDVTIDPRYGRWDAEAGTVTGLG